MRCFPGPRIVLSKLSKCVEFDKCRYDDRMISSDFMQSQESYVDFILVFTDAVVEKCLGIAQNTIHRASVASQARLMQPATDFDIFDIFDIADNMNDFCWHFLTGLPEAIK